MLKWNSFTSRARLQWGNTPLHVAAKSGHLEVVRLLLLDQGVDKDATSKVGAVGS